MEVTIKLNHNYLWLELLQLINYLKVFLQTYEVIFHEPISHFFMLANCNLLQKAKETKLCFKF